MLLTFVLPVTKASQAERGWCLSVPGIAEAAAMEGIPCASQRMPVYARNIVATSQPLAAQAGLDVLRRGGNAADAAVAAAICLTVVEPCSNGIGSDAFVQIWDGTRLHGINGSGHSPRALDAQRFIQDGAMPLTGWDAVTVPGCVDVWSLVSTRFGRLPFADLFTAAVDYAQNGFAISPITARAWASSRARFAASPDFTDFKKCFFPDDLQVRPGAGYRNPDQARSLCAIRDSHGEDFYRGRLAERIIAAAQAAGAPWQAADLAEHQSMMVEPLSLDTGDWQLMELPPNGQGIAAQIALGICRHHQDALAELDTCNSLHVQIEAMKLAFADAFASLADPSCMSVSPAALLDAQRLAQRAAFIDPQQAQFPAVDPMNDHGTVYLSSADADGMMVSFIQSNYMGFGSGIVIPDTGISMQNRAAGFVCTPGHPNCVAAGKRPLHTIIPGFIMAGEQPLCSFGVMGGHMQAQGHVQMFVRLQAGQDPQSALDAPRWYVGEDNRTVSVEPDFPEALLRALIKMGHPVRRETTRRLFGGGQIIMRTGDGYCGGSDLRKDGCAVGF